MATGDLPFSGSTNGKPILLSGGNDTVHTAAAGVGTSDRWVLSVANSTGAACTVTVYNGAVAAGNILCDAFPLPANGSPISFQGILNNGLLLICAASAANVATAWGSVRRAPTGS